MSALSLIRIRSTGFLLSVTVLICSQSAGADTDLLFILDGSNSMWGQIDGAPKIETARQTLGGLVTALPENASIGLMSYGHRREGDCEDVELIAPVGQVNADSLLRAINAITPTGKTPIALALEKSASAFADLQGQNNQVVLISDGLESCGGDPCAVAVSLAAAGVALKVHVIGFGVSQDEGQQLACIAAATGGQYFDAGDTSSFEKAVTEVAIIAQAEPEPAPPAFGIVFQDDFDGPDLSESWTVANPDPDSYIVEDGDLFMLSKVAGGLTNPDQPNIMVLDETLPSGNWRITLRFRHDLQTAREQLSLALYKDNTNYIETRLFSQIKCCSPQSKLGVHLSTLKFSPSGEYTIFEVPVWNQVDSGFDKVAQLSEFIAYGKSLPQVGIMQMEKQGRSYFSRFHFVGNVDEAGNEIWVQTAPVTSLRAPKKLVVNTSQWEATPGESLFFIESLVIEAATTE